MAVVGVLLTLTAPGDLCIDLECVEQSAQPSLIATISCPKIAKVSFAWSKAVLSTNFLFYADAGAFSSVHVAGSFNATDGNWPGQSQRAA